MKNGVWKYATWHTTRVADGTESKSERLLGQSKGWRCEAPYGSSISLIYTRIGACNLHCFSVQLATFFLSCKLENGNIALPNYPYVLFKYEIFAFCIVDKCQFLNSFTSRNNENNSLVKATIFLRDETCLKLVILFQEMNVVFTGFPAGSVHRKTTSFPRERKLQIENSLEIQLPKFLDEQIFFSH